MDNLEESPFYYRELSMMEKNDRLKKAEIKVNRRQNSKRWKNR